MKYFSNAFNVNWYIYTSCWNYWEQPPSNCIEEMYRYLPSSVISPFIVKFPNITPPTFTRTFCELFYTFSNLQQYQNLVMSFSCIWILLSNSFCYATKSFITYVSLKIWRILFLVLLQKTFSQQKSINNFCKAILSCRFEMIWSKTFSTNMYFASFTIFFYDNFIITDELIGYKISF